MGKKIRVFLNQAARKSGGDRYESGDGYRVYVPQEISRDEDGNIFSTIDIVFTPITE